MKLKKFIATLTAVAMLAGCLITADSAQVSAKTKYSDKITLYVGEKTTVSYKVGFVSVSPKKVKFKSFNKKIATISKKGVVKGKKKGTTKISGKYKGKTLYIKVTVKNRPGSKKKKPSSGAGGLTGGITPPSSGSNTNTLTTDQLAANLAINMQAVPSGDILLTVTNNNAQMVSSYTINYQLRNTSGVIISTGSVGGYVLQPGQTQYCVEYIGSDDIATLDVAQSQCSVKVNEYSYITYVNETGNIALTHQVASDNNISLTLYNSGVNSVYAEYFVLFYDAAGQLMDVESRWESLNPGETQFTTVRAPYEYDENFDHIPTYARYDVYYYAYSY